MSDLKPSELLHITQIRLMLTIIRPHGMHTMHAMRPVAAHVALSVVCVPVCWSQWLM